ncbi:MAG: redoxin family protein [Terriglobales bacterium]
MLPRLLAILLALSTVSFAGISDDVRGTLARSDPAAAESELQNYRAHQGVTPDYVEALSWMARASLQSNQLDRAETFAGQTEALSHQLLAKRPLDTDPHLATALGAALEVRAQVLAARGERAQAVALLRRSLITYRNTPIQSRLQKNLNVLALAGQPAPPLTTAPFLGSKPAPLAQFKGSPVLLFFWAHWCPDCKAEGPLIARLRSEFASRGLIFVAPTQLYGYTAGGEDAQPKEELPYIEQVWQHFYPGLQGVPVPVSKENFKTYGASTVPTIAVVDRAGRVSLYHPGAMPYEELRSAIEKAIR